MIVIATSWIFNELLIVFSACCCVCWYEIFQNINSKWPNGKSSSPKILEIKTM